MYAPNSAIPGVANPEGQQGETDNIGTGVGVAAGAVVVIAIVIVIAVVCAVKIRAHSRSKSLSHHQTYEFGNYLQYSEISVLIRHEEAIIIIIMHINIIRVLV